MAAPKRPRDERGWRIPQVGTLSHRVYVLAVAGVRPRDISEQLSTSRGNVRMLLHKMRHPDDMNAYAIWLRRRPAQQELR